MNDDAPEMVTRAVMELSAIPHAVLAILLNKLGGAVSLDSEDGYAVRGKAVAVRGESGTIRLWLVEPPE